jgi:hypothetical protein
MKLPQFPQGGWAMENRKIVNLLRTMLRSVEGRHLPGVSVSGCIETGQGHKKKSVSRKVARVYEDAHGRARIEEISEKEFERFVDDVVEFARAA